MVYNQIRSLEAKQNETEYKCLGSGKCCTIGLTIPMMECANIAFNITQQYYLYLEDKGKTFADEWIEDIVFGLKEAMYDETWQIGGETERKCTFFKNGCTIYRFRPMVCRTFGTVTGVDDYCPRIRNPFGQIDYYSGDAVKKIIQSFQNLLEEYAMNNDDGYDMVVYMPTGVLSFLLTTDELVDLQKNTDPKFWRAVSGWFNYRVQFTKDHGYDWGYLNEKSVSVNKKLVFNKE
jgi:Fe-S-cluster containining protein